MGPQNTNPVQLSQALPQQQSPKLDVYVAVDTKKTAKFSFLPKVIIILIIMVISGGGGFYVYQNFFKTGKLKLPTSLNLSFIPFIPTEDSLKEGTSVTSSDKILVDQTRSSTQTISRAQFEAILPTIEEVGFNLKRYNRDSANGPHDYYSDNIISATYSRDIDDLNSSNMELRIRIYYGEGFSHLLPSEKWIVMDPNSNEVTALNESGAVSFQQIPGSTKNFAAMTAKKGNYSIDIEIYGVDEQTAKDEGIKVMKAMLGRIPKS